MKIIITSDDGKKVVEVSVDDLSGGSFLNRVFQRRVSTAMNDVAEYERLIVEQDKIIPACDLCEFACNGETKYAIRCGKDPQKREVYSYVSNLTTPWFCPLRTQ